MHHLGDWTNFPLLLCFPFWVKSWLSLNSLARFPLMPVRPRFHPNYPAFPKAHWGMKCCIDEKQCQHQVHGSTGDTSKAWSPPLSLPPASSPLPRQVHLEMGWKMAFLQLKFSHESIRCLAQIHHLTPFCSPDWEMDTSRGQYQPFLG